MEMRKRVGKRTEEEDSAHLPGPAAKKTKEKETTDFVVDDVVVVTNADKIVLMKMQLEQKKKQLMEEKEMRELQMELDAVNAETAIGSSRFVIFAINYCSYLR
jgi:hypothetical protein